MLDKNTMVSAQQALPGRETPLALDDIHFVNQTSMSAEPKQGYEKIIFAMGCFWGAERLFWQLDGVISTSVGYTGGYTKNPTYEEVCSGLTGHTEAVRVIFDPQVISLPTLLQTFWEHHDPTQGMRQGNDRGTQYRSAIYVDNDQQYQAALSSKQQYQQLLGEHRGSITTEIQPSAHYYYAETYHQQYLAKNPNGYCGIGGTGVCFATEK